MVDPLQEQGTQHDVVGARRQRHGAQVTQDAPGQALVRAEGGAGDRLVVVDEADHDVGARLPQHAHAQVAVGGRAAGLQDRDLMPVTPGDVVAGVPGEQADLGRGRRGRPVRGGSGLLGGGLRGGRARGGGVRGGCGIRSGGLLGGLRRGRARGGSGIRSGDLCGSGLCGGRARGGSGIRSGDLCGSGLCGGGSALRGRLRGGGSGGAASATAAALAGAASVRVASAAWAAASAGAGLSRRPVGRRGGRSGAAADVPGPASWPRRTTFDSGPAWPGSVTPRTVASVPGLRPVLLRSALRLRTGSVSAPAVPLPASLPTDIAQPSSMTPIRASPVVPLGRAPRIPGILP